MPNLPGRALAREGCWAEVVVSLSLAWPSGEKPYKGRYILGELESPLHPIDIRVDSLLRSPQTIEETARANPCLTAPQF